MCHDHITVGMTSNSTVPVTTLAVTHDGSVATAAIIGGAVGGAVVLIILAILFAVVLLVILTRIQRRAKGYDVQGK